MGSKCISSLMGPQKETEVNRDPNEKIPGEEYTIRPRSIVLHMIPLPNPVCNITTYNENGLNILL